MKLLKFMLMLLTTIRKHLQRAISCLEQAVNMFCDIGRLSMAARYYKEIPELYESNQNIEHTIIFFEKTADLFQNEEVITSANQCKQKVGQYAAELEQYQKSIEIYEEIARQSLNNNLLKYGVKKHLLNVGICQLCKGDVVAITNALERYQDMDPTFSGTREYKLLSVGYNCAGGNFQSPLPRAFCNLNSFLLRLVNQWRRLLQMKEEPMKQLLLKWLELKKIEVYDCCQVKVFTSECLIFQENHEGQPSIPAQKSLFLVENDFANLEELTLSQYDLTIVLQQAQLRKLKVLHIISNGSAVFQVGLLQNIHNLEKLVLKDCPCEEIFSRGEAEEYAEMLAQIKSLKLNELWWIMDHLWKPDSKLDSFLQNLEILEVKYCYGLINLVPSSASFRNLTTLKVSDCRGLISLVTPQTAKSLVQLREVRVSECFMLKELVANEGDADDEIVFSRD